LTTIYSPKYWYFFNINNSFNKSDWFIKKEIEVSDPSGKVVLSTENRKLNIESLSSWYYTIAINYSFDIPKTYFSAMRNMEKKYKVEMSWRERFILALQAENPDPREPLRWWETQEIIYFPKNTEILWIRGDVFDAWTFESDFAKWASYKSRIIENQTTNNVIIDVRIY
jgi:hypothetical protein